MKKSYGTQAYIEAAQAYTELAAADPYRDAHEREAHREAWNHFCDLNGERQLKICTFDFEKNDFDDENAKKTAEVIYKALKAEGIEIKLSDCENAVGVAYGEIKEIFYSNYPTVCGEFDVGDGVQDLHCARVDSARNVHFYKFYEDMEICNPNWKTGEASPRVQEFHKKLLDPKFQSELSEETQQIYREGYAHVSPGLLAKARNEVLGQEKAEEFPQDALKDNPFLSKLDSQVRAVVPRETYENYQCYLDAGICDHASTKREVAKFDKDFAYTLVASALTCQLENELRETVEDYFKNAGIDPAAFLESTEERDNEISAKAASELLDGKTLYLDVYDSFVTQAQEDCDHFQRNDQACSFNLDSSEDIYTIQDAKGIGEIEFETDYPGEDFAPIAEFLSELEKRGVSDISAGELHYAERNILSSDDLPKFNGFAASVELRSKLNLDVDLDSDDHETRQESKKTLSDHFADRSKLDLLSPETQKVVLSCLSAADDLTKQQGRGRH